MNPDGLAFEGQWESNKRHGHGSQDYANCDRYEGWWYRGMCSGVGTYHFADGSRYEGAWANGRYDGNGVLYGPDGSRERHTYSGGLLKKRETLKPKPEQRAPRRDWNREKAVESQARNEVQMSVVIPSAQPSRHLIQRESAGMELSAPPLVPKVRPEPPTEGRPLEMDSTAPAPHPSRRAPLAERLYDKYFAGIADGPLLSMTAADPYAKESHRAAEN